MKATLLLGVTLLCGACAVTRGSHPTSAETQCLRTPLAGGFGLPVTRTICKNPTGWSVCLSDGYEYVDCTGYDLQGRVVWTEIS